MYEKILRDPLVFPDEVAASARSILTGLLTRDPAQRLGVNGAEEIKRHPFFEKIDWQRLAQKKIQPPFKPSVRSPVDVSNFDTVFTAEQPMDSVVEGSQLSQTVQAQFEGTRVSQLRAFVIIISEFFFFFAGSRVLVQCAWPHCGCGLSLTAISLIHSSISYPLVLRSFVNSFSHNLVPGVHVSFNAFLVIALLHAHSLYHSPTTPLLYFPPAKK